MPAGLLVDTDVLVDHLRGYPDAVSWLGRQKTELWISVVTVAELYAGLRGVQERNALNNFLMYFKVKELNREIAEQGGLFKRDYGKSHGTGLPDALIAATAENLEAQLITLNRKHFPMLKNTLRPYRKL